FKSGGSRTVVRRGSETAANRRFSCSEKALDQQSTIPRSNISVDPTPMMHAHTQPHAHAHTADASGPKLEQWSPISYVDACVRPWLTMHADEKYLTQRI